MSIKNVSGIKPVETETYANGLSKAKVAELETKAENLRSCSNSLIDYNQPGTTSGR